MLAHLEKRRSTRIVSILPAVMLSASTAVGEEVPYPPVESVVRIEVFELDPLRHENRRRDHEFLGGYRILDHFIIDDKERRPEAMATLRKIRDQDFRKPRLCFWPNYAFRIVAKAQVQELYVASPPPELMTMCNAVCEPLIPDEPRRYWDSDWHWDRCFCDCMWGAWLNSGRGVQAGSSQGVETREPLSSQRH